MIFFFSFHKEPSFPCSIVSKTICKCTPDFVLHCSGDRHEADCSDFPCPRSKWITKYYILFQCIGSVIFLHGFSNVWCKIYLLYMYIIQTKWFIRLLVYISLSLFNSGVKHYWGENMVHNLDFEKKENETDKYISVCGNSIPHK